MKMVWPHKPKEIYFEFIKEKWKILSIVQGSFILAKFLCNFSEKNVPNVHCTCQRNLFVRFYYFDMVFSLFLHLFFSSFSLVSIGVERYEV